MGKNEEKLSLSLTTNINVTLSNLLKDELVRRYIISLGQELDDSKQSSLNGTYDHKNKNQLPLIKAEYQKIVDAYLTEKTIENFAQLVDAERSNQYKNFLSYIELFYELTFY